MVGQEVGGLLLAFMVDVCSTNSLYAWTSAPESGAMAEKNHDNDWLCFRLLRVSADADDEGGKPDGEWGGGGIEEEKQQPVTGEREERERKLLGVRRNERERGSSCRRADLLCIAVMSKERRERRGNCNPLAGRWTVLLAASPSQTGQRWGGWVG